MEEAFFFERSGFSLFLVERGFLLVVVKWFGRGVWIARWEFEAGFILLFSLSDCFSLHCFRGVESLLLLFVAAYPKSPTSSLDNGAQHLQIIKIHVYQAQPTIPSTQKRERIRYVEKRGSETPTRPAEEIYKVIMNLIVPLVLLGSTDSEA